MATSFRDWPWPLQALFYMGLLCRADSRRFLRSGTAAQQRAHPASERPGGNEAARSGSPEPARLQAAPGGTAIGDGRAAKAAGHAADHRSGREADRPVHPDDSERGGELGRHRPEIDGETRCSPKPYYFEMPFDVEADGPYYSVLDFFARLGRLSRIINVGDLKLNSLREAAATSFG